jgi:hypothetical protein
MTDINNDEATFACQYCSKENSKKFNFCVKCHEQIKCIECGSATIRGVDICVICGKPLVNRSKNETTNTYTRQVKKDGEKYEENIHFSLSNEAVGQIAPFIIKQTMPGNGSAASTSNGSISRQISDSTNYEEVVQEDGSPSVDIKSNNNSEADVNIIDIASKNDVKSSLINEFFKNDNGDIIAIENDFKGQSWSEQQKNFIIIFAKAYQDILGVPLPDKEIIREAAKKIKLIDLNNFPRYLSKVSAEFMAPLSNGLELNSKGKKEALRILALMEDENAPAGFNYNSRPATGTVKKPRISSDERNNVDSWIVEKVDLKKLDIRNVQTGRDAALLALWLITKSLAKLEAVPMYTLLYYLNKQFTTLPVNSAAVSKSITLSKDSETFFGKNSDGNYFLTVVGEKLVEDWLSGAKLPGTKNSKS